MKFPSHIVLDLTKPKVTGSAQYWVLNYITTFNENTFECQNISLHKKFLSQKEAFFKNQLLQNQKLYTIRHSVANPSLFLKKTEKAFYIEIFKPRIKIKHKDFFSTHHTKVAYNFLKNYTKFDENFLNHLFANTKSNARFLNKNSSNLWSLFDINFLRKERIYTKLKYSRVPQYDIVSGGSAALLSGFLGFLISEKFGFEMVDSGDFYYLFMYFVFASFAIRPFLRIASEKTLDYSPVSLKMFGIFYSSVIVMLFKALKNLYKFITIK